MAHIHTICALNCISLNLSVPHVVYKYRLMVAACLGSNFDAELLGKAKRNNDIDDSFLESCDGFGFIQKVAGSKKYTWSHDQIQQGMLPWINHITASFIYLRCTFLSLAEQAAYDLIPLAKQESFHLLLGSRLFISTLPSEMDYTLFFIGQCTPSTETIDCKCNIFRS